MHIWCNEVRDYELDMQGVVNNANYLHYFEHARHLYLKAQDINLAQCHADGFDFVVVDSRVQYKTPLKANDQFYIKTALTRLGKIRFTALQSLYFADTDTLVAEAQTICACIDQARKKPCMPDWLLPILEHVDEASEQ